MRKIAGDPGNDDAESKKECAGKGMTDDEA